ncbi:MAG: hypothetical protein F4X57_08700 [Chloroflexi bacterium]|nr:hypothetical protein [Chloroflexota bacterium]
MANGTNGNDVDERKGKINGTRWVILSCAIGVLLALVVIGVLLIGGERDPDEMAREYIEGNIDKLGEDIAGFVVGDNWLLKELGGEYVEDRVNDVVHWSYSPARLVSDGEYRVTATASVVFNVDYDVLGRTFFVKASLPFNLVVRPGEDRVLGEPDYSSGRVEHDIPAVPQIPSSREAVEKADEAVDKAKGLLDKLGN